MSTEASFTVGDVNKPIEIPVVDEDGTAFDLATAVLLELQLESPRGIITTYTATPKSGETTTARYVLTGTEFIESGVDVDGWYNAQIEYELPSGEKGHSWPIVSFYVGRRLVS